MFGKKKTPATPTTGSRTYGHDRTIHPNTEINVETDENGRVVAVWYRCQVLPFTQTTVDENRAKSMDSMYQNSLLPEVISIELLD